jgi:hypothetical protein
MTRITTIAPRLGCFLALRLRPESRHAPEKIIGVAEPASVQEVQSPLGVIRVIAVHPRHPRSVLGLGTSLGNARHIALVSD